MYKSLSETQLSIVNQHTQY